MARMVVIYRNPKDPAAFDRHFVDVHAPLVQRLPGLRRMEISRGAITSRGDDGAHLVVILHFDSVADIHAAFASPAGQAAIADRMDVPPDSLTILQFEDRELLNAAKEI
jgi:uncharacterized protein (TIGR02118 family)